MAAVIPGEIARGTLGSALAAAREMPAPLGAKVVAVARDAFTRGMEVSVIVCAIIALVTAIFTIILLRSAPHAAAPGSAAH
jgi:DHA2 family multidrug resistance protein-like MFS transporter